MLSKEKQMDVLEAYDLTKSLRAAAELTGTDHHTVARYVAARAAGTAIEEMAAERPKRSDGFAEKIAEWVDRSNGKVRADVVHERLVAMGYSGSERTTRRVVAVLKASYRHANHRIYRPWIPEPGLWLQYDFGDGPVVEGVHTVSVLRLAGLEPLPGRPAADRPHHGLGGRRLGPHLSPHRRGADLRADRQREDGDRSPYRGDPGAQRVHGGDSQLLRGDHLHLRAL